MKKKETAEYPKNPIVHRGQDPELFWMNKYGNDDTEDKFNVDIRSLYRTEHISPEVLIKNFYKLGKSDIDKEQMDMFQMFGNDIIKDEIEKVSEYYKHQNDWTNRMILGDSLLVMNSLLEREGMSGKVQMIYFDPPYGIKYGSNWQMKLNNRNVKDGNDEALSGEPEQIKAYRDTWELGIHSYLSYIRDRLLIAKEMLTESGSCFIQISDENVHLIRNIMDEVFGSENFVSLISFVKTGAKGGNLLDTINDFVLCFAKDKSNMKYRQLYYDKEIGGERMNSYIWIELPTGERRKMTNEELATKVIPKDSRIFSLQNFTSQSGGENSRFPVEFESKTFFPLKNYWKTNLNGFKNLIKEKRVMQSGNNINYVRYVDDFPALPYTNIWTDTAIAGFSGEDKLYVVQTAKKVIQRCMLMTTDPGDLVIDPTCGSGTTAFVAEQWGRRWITTDTSRIALNIAKTRLMSAVYPYYKLHDEADKDIRQGFEYKKVPHITLKSLANDEPAEEETLFDQPYTDNKKLRVAGPFTVETLQNYDPVSPEDLDKYYDKDDRFIETVFEHLKSAGVKNGIKNEMAVFTRVEQLSSPYLNAEGFYKRDLPQPPTKGGGSLGTGEAKAYFHIGPKFGTVSKQCVNEAIKECRNKGDAGWLIILGFSFESDIENKSETTSLGTFEVTKVRMHDDLMQEGLLKKDKKAASFVTIGEPDIVVEYLPQPISEGGGSTGSGKDKKDIYKKTKSEKKEVIVEIKGLDIYDPIKDEVKSRDINDIAYWMLDDDYDGNNFMVRQVFFCGGEKDEYDKMKKNLEKLQKTLKIEIDEEAFERVYSHRSHPIEVKRADQKIAVKVVSQFGEESMKVVTV